MNEFAILFLKSLSRSIRYSYSADDLKKAYTVASEKFNDMSSKAKDALESAKESIAFRK